MKSLAIAVILAVTSISSVSSAFCMKKYLTSQGLAPNPSTNFYNQVQNRNSQPVSESAVAGNEQVNRQR
ncbi:MAG: hypothetical protein H7256_10390 [Bdellovibrio sp.]|nr:hypothetical protein [Bdellovibrio sp.]